jgi:hypothetical protein
MSKSRSSGDHIHLNPQLTLRPNVNIVGIAVSNEAVAQAISCVLANVLLASWKSCNRVLYSRDKNYYAESSATSPAWFSYRSVTRAVDRLVEEEFLVGNRTWASPGARFRSSFRMVIKLERHTLQLAEILRNIKAHPRRRV